MEFLNRIAKEIYNKNKTDYSDVCVVFPSKRSGLFFKRELAKLSGKPLWSPDVFSINEFTSELSELTLADHLTLVFRLYKIFRQFEGLDNFEKFYQWGVLMLNDFSEIDRYLIDPDKLFRNLKEIKDIDNVFQFDASDNEYFRRFWNAFSNMPLQKPQEIYLNIWENMGNVFRCFRKELLDENIAYEGLLYNELCSRLEKDIVKVRWSKVIFAGFNMLTPAEESVMKAVSKKVSADFFWNGDDYYYSDNKHEAGFFLRKSLAHLHIHEPKWIDKHLIQREKNIKITGVPLKAGQAKAMAGEISELISSGSFQEENTVIIIPDEQVLLPLLYSLPSDIKNINVTMGFPFRLTPLYNLLSVIRYIQLTCLPHKDGIMNYYYKDIIKLLSHPYIKKIITAGLSDNAINTIIEKNLIYIEAKDIKDLIPGQDILFDNIFECSGNAVDIIDKLLIISDIISEKFEAEDGNNDAVSGFEIQYFYCLYTSLINIRETMSRYSEEVNITAFWQLLMDILSEVRIPFSGEPLKGLQIMGLLEARNLDFDNVFILSMNEGAMPPSATRNSMIPFNLRRAFGLPVYEDDDSQNSYYFYSIIQRAKNINLYYDTQADEFLAGDISRYILQVEKELSVKSDKVHIQNNVVQFRYSYPRVKDIRITKTDVILNGLNKIYVTQLITYINCPLQFYLRKIAGLPEPAEMEEAYSPASFGTILHNLMQDLYGSVKDKIITDNVLNTLLDKVNDDNNYGILFNEALDKTESLSSTAKFMRGQNYLFKKTIQRLIGEIFISDKKNTPFEIKDLECWVEKELIIEANGKKYPVKIGGKIDRVDYKDELYKVIDYKTGNAKPKLGPRGSFEDKIDTMFMDIAKKEQLQSMLYAFLYREKTGSNKIISGIYPMRSVKYGVVYAKDEPFTDAELDYFEMKLKGLLVSIFDRSNEFIQAESIKNCEYCSYNQFCYK